MVSKKTSYVSVELKARYRAHIFLLCQHVAVATFKTMLIALY